MSFLSLLKESVNDNQNEGVFGLHNVFFGRNWNLSKEMEYDGTGMECYEV